MSELKWNWAYAPYLDPPENQKESAQNAGYVKVVSKDEADKVISRHKYKRCLAMARWCEMCHKELLTRACLPTKQNWNRHDEWRYFVDFWHRYEYRFRKLAEKFRGGV